MVVMKKSTINLTSALLMLNLISTSLYAATSLDENVAANRITRLFRLSVDKKLNRDFESIFQKESIIENIQNDPEFATRCLRESIDSLHESSSRSEIAAPLVPLFNAINLLDITPFVQTYKTYLDSQLANPSSIKGQWASIIKAFLVDLGFYKGAWSEVEKSTKLTETEALLQETQISKYPFFRFYSLERLSATFEHTDDRKQAIASIKKGFVLPKRYHAKVYDKLASLVDYSDSYMQEQQTYYKKIIEIGNPQEKAKARYQLARSLSGVIYSNQQSDEFYRPEELINLYKSIVSEAVPIAFSVPYFSFFSQYYMQILLAEMLMRAPDGIRDEAEANRIFDEILLREDYANWDYGSAVRQIIYILVQDNPNLNTNAVNQKRAFNLALEFIGNPRFPTTYKKLIEKYSLTQLYQSGPQGIRDPQKAVEILEKHSKDAYDPNQDPFLHPGKQLIRLLQSGPDEIRDHQKALHLSEELASDSSNPNYYSDLQTFANLLMHGDATVRDVHKAIAISEGALSDPKTPESYRQSIKGMLVSFYKSGPEEIRSHSRALQLLEELMGNLSNFNRLGNLQSLAHILQHGDATVRDMGRAIQVLEELCLHPSQKLNSLQTLVNIYDNDPVHKNTLKATECYKELLSFYADNPIEQLKALSNLLNLYASDGDAFSLDEVRATVQQILDHPSVDGTERLQIQVILSDLYVRHPEAATDEEKIEAHETLAHNPMANSDNMRIAYQRLIALYLAQENLPQVVTTFEQLLARAADWQRTEVINEYIAFLENPEYAIVQNAARVAELQAILLPQFLPQDIDFMFGLLNLDFVPQDTAPMAGIVHYVPGAVGGFGGGGYVDPSFSPEIRANVKASLDALSRDSFDRMNSQTNLERTIAEIKEAIAQYGTRDADFAATAAVATEVFETGNGVQGFRPAVHHLEYPFDVGDLGVTMAYGEALVRIWARITHHPDVNHLKDLIVVQLAAARDPDGHIVCEFGKLTRHLQVMEGHFKDIKATALSLQNIFSHFAKNETKAFDTLATDNPLKMLKAKCEDIPRASEFKVGEESLWVTEQYQAKFFALEAEEQSALNDHYVQLVAGFETELLKSRDALSEDERAFARREVGRYLSLAWFM
jgi:hypothetical protein